MGLRASPLPRGASGRRTRRGEAAERRVSFEPELGGSKGDGAARVSRGGEDGGCGLVRAKGAGGATYRDGGAPWSAGPSADVGAGQDSAGSPIRARGRGWS